jgi:hypothetical protein
MMAILICYSLLYKLQAVWVTNRGIMPMQYPDIDMRMVDEGTSEFAFNLSVTYVHKLTSKYPSPNRTLR